MFNAVANLSLVEQTIVDHVLQKSFDDTVVAIHEYAYLDHPNADEMRQHYCTRYLAVVHARGMR